MPKEDFGIINWANAVAVTLTIVVSFGMDQVVLRRISASQTSDWTAVAFFFHSVVGSMVIFLVLWMASGIFTNVSNAGFYFLPWFFIAQAIIAIANPFKQYLNAKHNFAPYAIIAIVANILKLVLAWLVIRNNLLTVRSVYLVLIFCASLEFVALIIYVRYKKLSFKFRFSAYIKLIKESFHQYVATLFDSSLSRIDWILIGIISTNTMTAEYSFAYRAYEMARLPLSILGPIILSVFAKLLANNKTLDDSKSKDIKDLFTVEIFFAMLLPLILNIVWSPLLDYFFDGKYGSVNHTQFLILSVCIPFQFFINMLWSLGFSSKYYKPISIIIGSTSVLNLALNIFAIPFWGAEGAAVAYLVTTIVQLVGYYVLVSKRITRFSYMPFIKLLVITGGVYATCTYFIPNVALRLICAVCLYVLVAFVSKTVTKKEIDKTLALVKK
ncbi:MAG: oligosaccharide flippase family protein [Chitinophagaceae bacterium]|nr:oligosaccharide flippase family protein [Chitinophagaceae bacterium]